ncbi:tetratricopeptide repeat protein, partial [Candidatus Fermentibacterales bacterium]|nr:tetratricopeptide repeat protein [Candidatus Fermentibacterales bacterium]
WSRVGGLRVRMGMHAGEAEARAGDYFGTAVNRAARIMSAAWGGQVLLSDEAAGLLGLPEGASLVDQGAHTLKDLLEPQRLFSLDHPDLPLREFPPLRTISSRPQNLPRQPTAFVGREREIDQMRNMLEGNPDCRLVTLLAPGGAGKTRLGLQAAAECIESFRDGVFFVPLEDLESGFLIAPALASALGFSFSGSRQEMDQLLAHMSGKEMLLILDNFEHLTSEAAIVSSILRSSDRIKVLVTSRHRLSLREEWIFELSGLGMPEGECADVRDLLEHEATRLFVQNARRVDPAFDPSAPAEVRSVARICSMVEGLPLAIELASTWVRMLSCVEIEQELEKSMELLQASLADLPGRQRSIRAVFDYSWQMLSDEERRALSRVSVFRGGFDRQAAAEVAGTSLMPLSRLIDKSLIRRSSSGRFEFHGLLRQFAEERLASLPGETGLEALLDSHCHYYARLLESTRKNLEGGGQSDALDQIALELDNVRAGWRRALAMRDPSLVSTYTQGLSRFYEMRSRFREGLELFTEGAHELERDGGRLAEAAPEHRAILGSMIQKQGLFSLYLAGYDEAGALLTRAMEIFRGTGSTLEVATCLKLLGNVSFRKGDLAEARDIWTRNLEMLRKTGSSTGMATALSNLGSITRTMGEFDRSREFYQEALEMARESGDHFSEAGILSNLGSLAESVGEYAWARELFGSSLEIRREIGDRKGIATALTWLGELTRESDADGARRLYEEALEIQREIGDRAGAARSYSCMGELSLAGDDLEGAERLFGLAYELSREVGNNWGVATTLENLGRLSFTRGEAGAALEQLSQSLELHRKIGEARAIVRVQGFTGQVLLALGRVEEASPVIREGLSSAVSLGLLDRTSDLLLGAAGVLLAKGRGEMAARCAAAVQGRDLGRWTSRRLEELMAMLPGPVPPVPPPEEAPEHVRTVLSEVLEALGGTHAQGQEEGK